MHVFHDPMAKPQTCRRCGSHELYEDHDWHLWCAQCDAWQGVVRHADVLAGAQLELPYTSPMGEADIL
jgi:hypothetical protein